MNILTYSSLYPNEVNPSNGIFVERRLLELIKYTDIRSSVISPVPWFPFRYRLFGKYAQMAAVPSADKRHGIDVTYPRYPSIPKIGMLLAPESMARATTGAVKRVINERGPIGLIDAHYFYPDGVAASLLADRFDLPFIVTARGSDINLIGNLPKPRKMITQAAAKAQAVVAVSRALGRALEDIGVDSNKIHILPNGVDASYFRPGDRDALRSKLNFRTPTFVSVGSLKEAKGHDVAIKSIKHIDAAHLVVIGVGEDERKLRNLVKSLNLQSRVSFTGQLSADELLEYYQAADALLLISRREGMPNVVLESLACGTPVIATDVGGIAEVVTKPELGELIKDRKPENVAAAWHSLNQRGIDRIGIRHAAESYTWDATIYKLHSLIHRCSQNRG